ncbi:hypothetical protein [Pseudothermotoga thermarum]|uniref:Uncharacterized protein n=1 Tax=Pseudothermotoga thermarum DSM 5069 TaxID=688269 RepID=F7YUK1_9THEM|nr:hypothetical protein [Pseudothermotoga thermarum]AEH51473.1 hypothetical protein Theth_1413 [Pseudothermotoga thermarum DSM 5069]
MVSLSFTGLLATLVIVGILIATIGIVYSFAFGNLIKTQVISEMYLYASQIAEQIDSLISQSIWKDVQVGQDLPFVTLKKPVPGAAGKIEYEQWEIRYDQQNNYIKLITAQGERNVIPLQKQVKSVKFNVGAIGGTAQQREAIEVVIQMESGSIKKTFRFLTTVSLSTT